jgi:hypothetical protein
MTYDFRPAKRENTQLIIGGVGASGSGKTYTLFELATGLAYPEASNAEELNAIIAREGKHRIVSIDTERGRALHYAPPPGAAPDPWKTNEATFAFDHILLEPPFSPQAYQAIVEAADEQGYGVIILDSGSHEWAGEGGVLEMFEADQYERAKRKANWNNRGNDQKEPSWSDLEAVKMSAWIKPKMAHKRLVGRLTTLRAHLLIALRGEEKVHMEKDPSDPQGKRTRVVAAADLPPNRRWSPVCEKSFPFELTISFVLSPDAPGVPIPLKIQDQHRPFFPLEKPIDIETGRRLAAWAGGAAAAPSATSSAGKATGTRSTSSGGGKRSPEELVADFKASLRDCKTLDDYEDLWTRSQRFRDQLEERGLTSLHQQCMDAADLRREELSAAPKTFELEDE